MRKQPAVTGWIEMETPPLKQRTGWYDVRFQSGVIERWHCWRGHWAIEPWKSPFAVGWRGLAANPKG